MPFCTKRLAFRWLKVGGLLSAPAASGWKKDFNCTGRMMLNRMKKGSVRA